MTPHWTEDGDESAYRWEIDDLVVWCGQNNLELNALKGVDLVVDFRKNAAPLYFELLHVP